jgi:chromosome segregation ATPase
VQIGLLQGISHFEIVLLLLCRENKVLSESLGTVGDKHKSVADDKKDQAGQIERLRQQLRVATQQRDTATAELDKLRTERSEAGKRLDAEHGRVGQLQGVEQQATALTLQVEKLKADHAVLASERDSLIALLAQKDSQLQGQAQHSERSLHTLQMKLAAVERTLALSAASGDGAVPVPPAVRCVEASSFSL